jgi:hypothetical protein
MRGCAGWPPAGGALRGRRVRRFDAHSPVAFARRPRAGHRWPRQLGSQIRVAGVTLTTWSSCHFRGTFQADVWHRHRGRLSAAGLLPGRTPGLVRRPDMAMLDEGSAGAGPVGPRTRLAGAGDAVARPPEPPPRVRSGTGARLDLPSDVAGPLHTVRAVAPRPIRRIRPGRPAHESLTPLRPPADSRRAHRAGRARPARPTWPRRPSVSRPPTTWRRPTGRPTRTSYPLKACHGQP